MAGVLAAETVDTLVDQLGIRLVDMLVSTKAVGSVWLRVNQKADL